MKKVISLTLCILLIFSTAPLIRAAEKAELEKVLISVRERIGDTSEYKNFDSNTYTEKNNSVYNFTWSNEGENYKSLHVSALKSGIITNYSQYSRSDDEKAPGFDRISVSEAIEKTTVLINKLNPSLEGKLIIDSDNVSEEYSSPYFSFNIKHIENNIPVMSDTGYITVDTNAEKIKSFSISYTENLTYKEPSGVSDKAAAKAAFTEKIGLKPYYRVYTNYKEKKLEVFPVYSIEDSSLYINAHTTEPEKISHYDIYLAKNMALAESSSDTGGGGSALTEAEKSELSNYENLISAEAAEKIIRDNKYFSLDESYKLSRISTTKNIYGKQSYTYSMHFEKAAEKNYASVSASVNAESGEILSYYDYDRTYDDKIKPDTEKLSKKAEEIILSLAPQKKAEYKAEEYKDGDDHFTYLRYVNGLEVPSDSITVEFDAKTEKLTRYRINYTDAEFPSVSDILTNEQICEKYFEASSYELVYIPQITDGEDRRAEANLFYSFENSSYTLDAFSGKRINYDGTDYAEKPSREPYTDISGHYAQEQIEALRRFGIGFEGNLFKPEEFVLQKDFIALLATACGYGNAVTLKADTKFEDYYNYAVRCGIIKKEEIKEDLHITRIDAAKFISRALKIDNIAEIEGIYNCPFSDVTEGKGYATLLWGLKILKGTSENTFSPYNNITRAQSAILVYNMMSHS